MLSADDIELRRGKITSSSIAAIMGIDPCCTPLKAWSRITGRDDGVVSPAVQARFDRGHILEGGLIDYATRRVGAMLDAELIGVDRPPTITGPAPWAADSADAIASVRYEDGTTERFGVEAKTVGGETGWLWGEDLTQDVPEYVAQQCHWHMWHHDVDTVAVPVLLGVGLEIRLLFVRRDEQKLRDLVERAHGWWERHVATDAPPEPTSGTDLPLIERLRAATTPSPISDADGSMSEAVRSLAKLRADAKVLQVLEQEAKLAIANVMGEHEVLLGPWGSVTWRRNKNREVVDWQAIAMRWLVGLPHDERTRVLEEHRSSRPGDRVMRIRLREEDEHEQR